MPTSLTKQTEDTTMRGCLEENIFEIAITRTTGLLFFVIWLFLFQNEDKYFQTRMLIINTLVVNINFKNIVKFHRH